MSWQYLGRKSHCWKAHFFTICFFVKYFCQRLLSLVNKGLHAAIIWLSPLIREGKQRYKPYIVGDPRMVIWWVASVTPHLKNPDYAPVQVLLSSWCSEQKAQLYFPLTLHFICVWLRTCWTVFSWLEWIRNLLICCRIQQKIDETHKINFGDLSAWGVRIRKLFTCYRI